jgi:thiamine-phosphate pyrophosphorylase
LIDDFNLKGIYFKEQVRKDTLKSTPNYFRNLDKNHKIISSSFHNPEELARCTIDFKYHFLSPVLPPFLKKDMTEKVLMYIILIKLLLVWVVFIQKM